MQQQASGHPVSLVNHMNIMCSLSPSLTEVGLFCVDSQEHVKKYEDVDAMSVFRYRESIPGQPPAFLQCGDFVYPLVPGKSPVLKASDHVYMFPELKGEKGEESWGW